MNFLRLLGDACHLTSILILIYKIHARKTTAGISLRTRVLYLFVFLARYGDLFLYYVSFYNTFMKILYLSTTGYIIYLMTISPEFKNTWYHDLDNFAALPLVVVSAVFALLCTSRYSVFEIMWTFSIILESVAILPQIDHLTKVPTLPALPLSHLVALGLYRFFYVLHWAFRAVTEGTWDFTVFFFGLVQTIIWADFLVVWYYRKQIKLPPNSAGQGARSEEAGVSAGQVDEGDMSSSFVITHIFAFIRMVEDRFMAGRRIPGLSVSAYPDAPASGQQVSSTAGSYSDQASQNTTAQEVAGEYVIRSPSAADRPADAPLSGAGRDKSVGTGDPAQSGDHYARALTVPREDGFEVDSDDGAPPAT